jgi:hypothetical protein
MLRSDGLLAVCLAAITISKSETAANKASLHAWLEPPSSSGPCTVLQLQQSTIPADTTWLRLRRAEPGASMPGPIHPDSHSSAGFWFLRTPSKPAGQLPRGVQQVSFLRLLIQELLQKSLIEVCVRCSWPFKQLACLMQGWSQ